MRSMRLFRNTPIRRKLTLITMATSCAALVLACVGFLAYELALFRSSLTEGLTGMAKMIGDNSAAALSFGDPSSAEATLRSLSADPHILTGVVYDAARRPFAQYRRGPAPAGFTPPPVEPDGCRFRDDYLEIFQRIQLKGEAAGTVYLRSDLAEMRARAWQYAAIVGIVMAASLLLAFIISRYLQHIIAEPVSRLSHIASLVAREKDYSVRVTKDGDDELGRLIDGFNEMLQEIQARDLALQAARDDLEQRVEARTLELRSSQERLQLTIDTALDAIVTADQQGRIIEWNVQAEKTFGWTRDEALGRSLAELVVPPALRDANRQGWNAFLKNGVGPVLNKRVEITALHKDGRALPIELAISPVRLENMDLFSAFLRDITERKQAGVELESAHRQLVQASRQAGMAEVATGVLHNVGNVLNSVNVSSTLIGEKLKRLDVVSLARVVNLLKSHEADLGAFLTADAKGKRVVGFLDQLASHMATQQSALLEESVELRKNVEHIKDIVAMQQNYARISGVMEPVNIAELLEDAIRLNLSGLDRSKIEVIRNFQDLPPTSVDRHKILQIVVNLIRNARHACAASKDPNPRITIRLAALDGSVNVEVTDNGVGIPAENLTRIFSHGFTTKRDGHGFGLHSGALAAQEMGGSLQVHSDGVGRGASFTLRLPQEICQPMAA